MCAEIDPNLKIPHPHIYEYANGKTKPTRDKAPVLSAALAQLGAKAEPPTKGLSVRELCYYDGLPEGARMDGEIDDELGSEEPNTAERKAAAA